VFKIVTIRNRTGSKKKSATVSIPGDLKPYSFNTKLFVDSYPRRKSWTL